MADYFDTGFCVRQRSWHGKETLLAEAPKSWDEARAAAGLTWEPQTIPVYRKVVDDAGVETFEEIRSNKLVVRDDTLAGLGVVSDSFELITHAEMGQIIETFLGEANAEFETAGSVKGGAQVWALMRLDEPYTIKGDIDGFGDPVVTLPYFAVTNSHTGTGSCKGLYTQVRIVCANTVQAADADGDRTGAQFSLRHTSGVKARIDEAKDILKGARAEALRWRTIAESLALIPISPDHVTRFLSEFIPEPPAGAVTDRVRANIASDRSLFLHTLNNSVTNCAMKGNALGLVNAAVEYLDHVRGFRDQATYMGRQILRAEPGKAKAVKLVRELVAA